MSPVPASFNVSTTRAGRRYVDAADVAAVCDLLPAYFNTHAWPTAWVSPRDYWADGSRVWFAVVSLGALADWLQARGLLDAALKLRTWATAWIETAIAEEVRRNGPSPREPITAGSGDRAESAEILKGWRRERPAAAPAQPVGEKPMWYQHEEGGMA